jgi:hypothetical protein
MTMLSSERSAAPLGVFVIYDKNQYRSKKVRGEAKKTKRFRGIGFVLPNPAISPFTNV